MCASESTIYKSEPPPLVVAHRHDTGQSFKEAQPPVGLFFLRQLVVIGRRNVLVTRLPRPSLRAAIQRLSIQDPRFGVPQRHSGLPISRPRAHDKRLDVAHKPYVDERHLLVVAYPVVLARVVV